MTNYEEHMVDRMRVQNKKAEYEGALRNLANTVIKMQHEERVMMPLDSVARIGSMLDSLTDSAMAFDKAIKQYNAIKQEADKPYCTIFGSTRSFRLDVDGNVLSWLPLLIQDQEWRKWLDSTSPNLLEPVVIPLSSTVTLLGKESTAKMTGNSWTVIDSGIHHFDVLSDAIEMLYETYGEFRLVDDPFGTRPYLLRLHGDATADR